MQPVRSDLLRGVWECSSIALGLELTTEYKLGIDESRYGRDLGAEING